MVAGILDRLGVPYVAAGSFASSVHGEPRSTDDVDLVADLRPGRAAAFVAALGREWYVSADAVREAVAGGGSFNAVHLASGVKLDVFVVGSDRFDAHRVASGGPVRVGGDPGAVLRVDTAEHTVLRKLEWFRRGGEVSDRQWRDVVGVLRAQGARLDRRELAAWAERLGVSDLLARALRDAGVEGG
ncbi:MAG: hypothetical protein ACREMC_04165 [Gemmatimonadales bacterium]